MTERFKLSIIHMQMVNRNRYGWHIFEGRHRLIALGWRAAHDKFASHAPLGRSKSF